MKVNANSSLVNRYLTESKPTEKADRVFDDKLALTQENVDNFRKTINSPERIITNSEKNFFKEIFPDNANTIENHVVFNRNGKLKQQHHPLGMIFDGKF